MPRVAHFEIPADDPERAVKFYQNVFGWKADKWAGPMEYWLVKTGESKEPGIDGGIVKRGGMTGVTTNTVNVTDLDASIKKIEAAGGKVVAPRMSVPGVGYMAYCKDTEGNVFGIMQADTTAK